MSPESPELHLKNQLCFPLYAAAKEMVRKYTPFLEAIDLTYTQYITMMVLWERGEVTVKELSESLYLDSGTLTPLLKRLEAKKLITRRRSPKDERLVDIVPTEQAELLRERARQVPLQMSRCVTLEAEDAKALYQLLYKLLDRLQ